MKNLYMRRNPTETLRTEQNYGPCLELGEFVGETAMSMSYIDPETGARRRVSKKRKPAFRGETPPNPHVGPCSRCLDHPESRHGPGYCMHGRKGHCETCMSMRRNPSFGQWGPTSDQKSRCEKCGAYGPVNWSPDQAMELAVCDSCLGRSRRNPWDGRSGICPVCSKNQIGCGNCAPCIDRGGYSRGCTTQMCQSCYEMPGDFSRAEAGHRKGRSAMRRNPMPVACSCGSGFEEGECFACDKEAIAHRDAESEAPCSCGSGVPNWLCEECAPACEECGQAVVDEDESTCECCRGACPRGCECRVGTPSGMSWREYNIAATGHDPSKANTFRYNPLGTAEDFSHVKDFNPLWLKFPEIYHADLADRGIYYMGDESSFIEECDELSSIDYDPDFWDGPGFYQFDYDNHQAYKLAS